MCNEDCFNCPYEDCIKDRQKESDRVKKYYQDHIEARRAKGREYYHSDKEKYKENYKRWYEENKERKREYDRLRYQQRKAGLTT